MASEDAENKLNNTEAAKPENKSKAKPKSRKAKPKPKKTAERDEKPDVKKAENQEAGSEQQTEAKPEAAAAPEAEKPAKKKAKSRGRKPKAKPKADEAAQASAPAAEPAKPVAEKTEPATPAQAAAEADQAEGQPGKQVGARLQEPAPEAESSTPPAEGKKRSKAKRRGKPKKNKPAQDSAKPEVPHPATPPELAAEETIAEYEAGEEERAEPVTDDATEPVSSPPPPPPVPKQQPPLIIVASRNPAKIKAAELAFSSMFPDEKFDYEGIAVESGVSDQPMSDDETFAGAFMRAQQCRETRPEATYWVGLEGGLEEIGEELHAFAWMVIFGPDELMGKSRTATFVLPPTVAELILVEGKELGEADDVIFGQTNSKQNSGAVGILTHGLIDRANYYAQALTLALVPFKNPHLYKIEQAEALEAEA